MSPPPFIDDLSPNIGCAFEDKGDEGDGEEEEEEDEEERRDVVARRLSSW